MNLKTSDEKKGKKDNREICKYGSECYQKNPFHMAKFRHPKRSSDEPLQNDSKKNKQDSADHPPSPSRQPDSTDKPQIESDRSPKNDQSVPMPSKLHDISNSSDDEEDEDHGKQVSSRTECSSTRDSPPSRSSENLIVISELKGDVRDKLKQLYVVRFPDDLFSFFDYCRSVYAKTPKTALRDVALELVGPFDLLSGDIDACSPTDVIRHYRYFYDPPEFFTVLRSTESDFHYGYFFDDPEKPAVFVGSNDPSKNCIIKVVAPNIFGAVNDHISKTLKICDPFKKVKIRKLQASLNEWAKKDKLSVDTTSKELKRRNAKINTKTFHEAGLVVPYDQKTDVGYRPLVENNKTLKELLTNIRECDTESERDLRWSKVDHVITFASIAADECDFGTPLELGINMFCMGHDCFHNTAQRLMSTGYNLLGRNHFSTVIEVHLKHRCKGSNLNFAALKK